MRARIPRDTPTPSLPVPLDTMNKWNKKNCERVGESQVNFECVIGVCVSESTFRNSRHGQAL